MKSSDNISFSKQFIDGKWKTFIKENDSEGWKETKDLVFDKFTGWKKNENSKIN